MNDQTETVQPPLAVAIVEGATAAASYIREGRPKAVVVVKPHVLTSSAIYDGLAALYNDANKGALLVVDLPNKPTTGNLHKVLLGRGLVKGVDYALFRAKADVHGNNFGPRQRPLVLEKLTDAPITVPQSRKFQAQMLANEAVVRGVKDLRLLHATPKTGVDRTLPMVDLPLVRPERTYSHNELLEERFMQVRKKEFNPVDAEADRELRAIRLPDLEMGQ